MLLVLSLANKYSLNRLLESVEGFRTDQCLGKLTIIESNEDADNDGDEVGIEEEDV